MGKKRLGGALAAAAMLAASAAPVAQTDNSTPQTVKRDAVDQVRRMPVKPVQGQKAFTASYWSGRSPGVFLNQRQYRKRCRQNPYLYNSRKHRSKN